MWQTYFTFSLSFPGFSTKIKISPSFPWNFDNFSNSLSFPGFPCFPCLWPPCLYILLSQSCNENDQVQAYHCSPNYIPFSSQKTEISFKCPMICGHTGGHSINLIATFCFASGYNNSATEVKTVWKVEKSLFFDDSSKSKSIALPPWTTRSNVDLDERRSTKEGASC